MPVYNPPLRDMQFVMHEVLGITDDFKAMPRHAEVDADTVNAILEEGGKFASEVLLPLNRVGDEEGCRLDRETHEVKTPTGFKAAYAQYVEGGWPSLSADPAYGGQGLPIVVNQAFYEMLNSANQAWTMYPGLSHGAYECLHAHGTPEQKALIKKYPSALATYSLDLYDKKKQDIVDAKMAEATKLRATKPTEGFVMALTEVKGQVPVSKLFNRGDHDQPKTEVKPGELGILAGPMIEPFKPVPVSSGSSGRRLAYAQWLTSGKHPLTARVLVNRFWMHHMGRGLVNTPGDFGRQGELPTHPELLDELCKGFIASKYDLKWLHRNILQSRTYQQSVRPHRDNPGETRHYASFYRRRLPAELLIDAITVEGIDGITSSTLLLSVLWGS